MSGFDRPVEGTANPNWRNATCPLDLVPDTLDPAGIGQKMVELVGLPVVTQGDVAGKTFGQVADAYQLAIVRKIWGDLNAKQRRAIRKVFLKVGKGNGKTTTAAFIALAHCMNLAMSGRGTRGLIQILSATIPAADLCFQHILSAVQADDELARQFKSSVAKRQIEHVSSGIKIEVSPARLDATVGRRPIMLLVDELHLCAIECRQFAQVLDQARKGGANWGDDFLEVAISTAPPVTAAGVYSETLTYARKVRDGEIDDPSFLPILFEIPTDEGGPDVTDPAQWWRGCPALADPDGPLKMETIQEEFEAAKRTGIPREMALFLSQRLGVEPNQSKAGDRTPLQEHWPDLTPPPDPAAWPDCIALDPGGTNDPAAAAFLWRIDGGGVGCRVRQYLTREGFDRAGDALQTLYRAAIEANELLIFETGAELDAAMIAELVEFSENGVSCIGGDRHGRAGFVPALQERLYSDFVEVRQGWQLLRAYTAADAFAADLTLHPVRTPLLTANIENLTLDEGPTGRRFKKLDAGLSGAGQLKIDGAMALLSGLELLLEHAPAPFDVGAYIG